MHSYMLLSQQHFTRNLNFFLISPSLISTGWLGMGSIPSFMGVHMWVLREGGLVKFCKARVLTQVCV